LLQFGEAANGGGTVIYGQQPSSPINGGHIEYTNKSPSGSVAAWLKLKAKLLHKKIGGKFLNLGELLLTASSGPGIFV
jgi:hypothetical protein